MVTNQPKLEIELLETSRIFADPDFNVRGHISPLDVTDLAQSMKDKGLQQPITVQPWLGMPGFDYRVVIGHRRHKSAEILQWDTVPCMVRRDLTEDDAIALNFIENIQRKDLNILQEARGIERMVARQVTQKDIAKLVNKSTGWVAVRIKLLELPPDIQAEAAAGRITGQHIKDIHNEPSRERQYEMVRTIKDRVANGIKTPVPKPMRKSLFAKRLRGREEIFEMISHIGGSLGYGLATRALAWASGEITDMQFYGDLKKLCDTEGIAYSLPKELQPENQVA